MSILFLMLSYPKEGHGGNMYTDLVAEVVNLGHNVVVVAPHQEKTTLGLENGVRVLRVKTGALLNVGKIRKGINNVILPFQYKKAIIRHLGNEKFNWIVSPTPPITLSGVIHYCRNKFKARSYLILRDIFPQNAVDLGMMNKGILYRYFRKKEIELYAQSDLIGCMSKGNIEYLKLHNDVSDSKLKYLPNWIKMGEFSANDVRIAKKYDLDNKFVCLFGGNFGIPQAMEHILELAASVKDYNEIMFLMIGRGTEYNRISRMIDEMELKNIKVFPRIPREDYLKVVPQCDVGLVNLSEKFTIPNIPSRTLAYWNCKLPVLACVDKNTDLTEIISKYNGGLSSIAGDVDTYRRNLLYMFQNKQEARSMGDNGYRAIQNEFNSQEVTKMFLEQLLNEVDLNSNKI